MVHHHPRSPASRLEKPKPLHPAGLRCIPDLPDWFGERGWGGIAQVPGPPESAQGRKGALRKERGYGEASPSAEATKALRRPAASPTR